MGLHYTGGQLDCWLSPLRRVWAVISDGLLEWTAMDDAYDVCYSAATRVERYGSRATVSFESLHIRIA